MVSLRSTAEFSTTVGHVPIARWVCLILLPFGPLVQAFQKREFQSMLFSLTGAALYIIASGVSLADYVKNHPEKSLAEISTQYKDQTIAAGIISLFVAVIYLVDVILSSKLL